MKKLISVWSLVLMVSMVLAAVVIASDVDVAVVDVSAPINAVTLAPGGSAPIVITATVTGKQEGTATFKVYTDWTLTDGEFIGASPQLFTVYPREAKDDPNIFTTSGTVTVASGHADGTFTLAVGAFDITNSNATGAKLGARHSSNYEVTVEGVQQTYTIYGFYKPVDMGGVWNTVKGGSTVPLKFNIEDDLTGELVTSTDDWAALGFSFYFGTVACEVVGGAEAPIEETATGKTSLRYDFDGEQYVYNWQTPKTKLCYAVTITVPGDSITAYFKLK